MSCRHGRCLCFPSVVVVLALAQLTGCATPLYRAQNSEETDFEAFIDEETADDSVKLIRDLAVPWGLRWLKIEGVALVTQLDGTGSDPPPSPLRSQLEKEMQTHNVRNRRETLASDDTAMALVRGFIPPAAEKGDTFDIEVRIPPRSQTKDLAGGWMMRTRLREVQMLGAQLREGHVTGLAQGEILVDSLFDESDEAVLNTRGRVLGGGLVRKDRMFGLAIRDQHVSIRTSAMIGAAINERFHHFRRGEKSGVANPRNDNIIEVAVHPRYKKNLTRYIRVIQSIAIGETSTERLERLARLESMLFEPTHAEDAALQLEAIGQEGLPILRRGLASSDPQIRFYSAEALAYLEEVDASDALQAAARDERAFRWRALAALSVIDHVTSQDALIGLMDEQSAETRYGAFRALREQNSQNPLVRGEVLNKSFALHSIASSGPPMIHFSHTRRPEIVLFGRGQKIKPPSYLYAGKKILIMGIGDDRLRVSLFVPDEETKQIECSTRIEDVIRTIAELGGGYHEVLQAIRSADKRGMLVSRVEMNALPRPGRKFHRDETSPGERRYRPNDPIPVMFTDRLGQASDSDDDERDKPFENYRRDEDDDGEETFFGRVSGWFKISDDDE